MAIQVVNHEFTEEQRIGDLRVDIVNFKGDNSYVTGGRPGLAALLGFTRIVAMVPLSHKGYIWEHNPDKDSIVFYQQPAAAAAGASPEVTAATNLSAVTYRALVLGQ